jgi:hypothetical protein
MDRKINWVGVLWKGSRVEKNYISYFDERMPWKK